MKKKAKEFRILLTGLAAAAALAGGCGGRPAPASSAADESKAVQAESAAGTDPSAAGAAAGGYGSVEDKLDRIQSVIDQYYMEPDEGKDVTAQDFEEGIYKGYVDALDEPYSVYYTEEEYKTLMESSSGRYSGIGVVVTQNVNTGLVTVVRPFAGSPGQKAGMEKGDVINKVDGKEATGEDLNTVVSWIKGEAGTKVEIEIYREDDQEYHTLSVERANIEVPEVEYAMLEGNVGYVEILEFEEPTPSQFDKAVDDLISKGMTSLIIDLRDNPGGLLETAVSVLDRILPAQKLAVYTVDKNDRREDKYTSDDETIDVPIIVLTNENTASASEIVSGCLQDYKAATLVGSKTFGKGIVQYVLPLGDGSALKLTSAKYYTPEGRNIHGVGIEPDQEEILDKEDAQRALEAGETIKTDSGEIVLDNQLRRAIDLSQGK